LIQYAEYQTVSCHRKTGMYVHSHRFVTDLSVAFHLPSADHRNSQRSCPVS
jgi:hypothetical protein